MKKKMTVLAAMAILLMLLGTSCSGSDADTDADGETLGETYGTLFSSFTARDLEGASVDESLVLDNEYTLVYVWATTCSPCVESLPKMEQLYEDYKDDGFAILGMVADLQDSEGNQIFEKVTTAAEIVSAQGVTFNNIDIPPAVREMIYNEIQYTPTAFFVDKEGRIVGDLYVGVYDYEDWSDTIEEVMGL